MGEEFMPKEQLGRSAMRELFDWVESGMLAVVCVVLIFIFVGRMAGVDGDSMYPTLHHEDRLLITRMFYTPQNGDIVVLTKPNRNDEPLIKRVIAIGGQEIDINFETSEVFVDGKKLNEPYIAEPTENYYDVEFPQVVPEGHVFVMGDNRNNSWDSRDSHVGMIDERYILGKVIYRILPIDSMGVPAKGAQP